jgi:hypothetical protein
MSTIKELVSAELDQLIYQAKAALKEVKNVALAQAWKILQLAVANIIQSIENIADDLSGKDKKALALELLSKFYDSVFIVIDVPLVPNLVEPIIHKHIKSFLMILLGATIDAMVTTFRNTGVFVDPSIKLNTFVDVKPRVSDK